MNPCNVLVLSFSLINQGNNFIQIQRRGVNHLGIGARVGFAELEVPRSGGGAATLRVER